MSKNQLYGKELTWGLSSVMTEVYDEEILEELPQLEIYLNLLNDDIENENMISSIYDPIWTSAYRVVANCNNLLLHVTKADSAMFAFPQERNIIEGEALAIRALMHFEMLRLFGYSLEEAGANEKRIPYVNEFYEVAPTYYNTTELLDLIIADFLAAAELLRIHDLNMNKYFNQGENSKDQFSIDYSIEGYDDDETLFMSARGTRLNYYAVQLLLARAYLFNKDYDNAYLYANNIYGNSAEGTAPVFGFTSYWSKPTTEEAMSPFVKNKNEVLFASYQEDMIEMYQLYGTDEIELAIGNKDDVFGSESGDDGRCVLLINDVNNSSLRWTSAGEYEDYIPVVRVTEAYHIVAECMLRPECSAYNRESAIAVLDNVRKIRFTGMAGYLYAWYHAVNVKHPDATDEDLLDLIWNDIHRESMDEGLAAWTDKRLGKGLSQPFPLPRKEVDYLGL